MCTCDAWAGPRQVPRDPEHVKLVQGYVPKYREPMPDVIHKPTQQPQQQPHT